MFAKTFVLASLAALASAANYDVNVGGLDNGSPILKFNPEVRLLILRVSYQRAPSC
jgi:hypothetical protein